MSSNKDSASRWLNRKVTEAKRAYISAAVCTLLSAGCFVVFSWYLSGFAALWLRDGIIGSTILLYGLVFLTGRYLFAHVASLCNYQAANAIVSNMKKSCIRYYLTIAGRTP
ncbi:MAG: hypothetical protein LUG51_08640 [Tannerellaceae bacterium]|nr:hypothetical protein [Tannerellaceae bacterium]